MANTKKIVAFGLGVVVVGGLAWYLMSRRKEQRMTPMITNLPPLVNTPTTTTASPVDVDFDTEIGIRNAGGEGKYKWYGIKTNSITKANAGLQIGTVGLVNGKEKCTINDFWTNSKGQISAFRCEEKEVGSYDIPNPSRFEY
tara:strand:+ start:1518 stop:1943 length:426 start_codon:yes stop_codon:yes gene_type:complete